MKNSHAAPRGNLSAAWLIGIYLLICVAPLGLAFTDLMPSRGFWINFSIALGFVALSVLGLQFALTTRASKLTAPFGIDAILRYHRQITLLAVFAAFGHPLILFLVSDQYRPLLDVIHAPGRAKLAWVSVFCLTALVITSVFRRVLRMHYTTWHAVHTVLGVICVLTALGHALLVHYYTSEIWVQAVWLLYGAAFLWVGLWMRVVKPLRMGLEPWRVTELWPEPGGALTVGLEPAFRRHHAFDFQAGQFAWVLPNRNPLTLTYHPFTMSSSALASRVDFTIKPVGAFTDALRSIRLGDRMYLDGPHGTFTLQRNPSVGYVFIATGVGVTPFLSMLATMADTGDLRPCWLFLGNRYETQITGIRQLSKLCARLPNLRLVNVISKPTDDWPGERGHVNADVLMSYLPQHYHAFEYYLCGRPEVMDSLAVMLHRDLYLPSRRIHAEDFELV